MATGDRRLQDALAALPETETTKRQQLQLARANARIHVGELPEAMFAMERLLVETAEGEDRELEAKVRASLASAQYYTGWLMRLELAEKKEWKEPLEKARQNFRLLAEQTPKADAKASGITRITSRPSSPRPHGPVRGAGAAAAKEVRG
ncbi:MAG: hypothetical protein CM1200mP34_1180 [Verrucomicrobiales bacterium]|nr:MAG: hypothetical protein CM1200mP34_1180 [Verrucomicrobiales bacterium]